MYFIFPGIAYAIGLSSSFKYKITEIMKNITNIALTVLVLLASTNAYADGDTKKSSKVISKIESAFDTELKLENWMTEFRNFSTNEFFTESELTLENWMLEAFPCETEVFVEADLELENWMTESFEFNEDELVMEEWMMNFETEDTFTEDELVLEDWMLVIK